MRFPDRPLAVFGALFALCLLVYGSSLQNDFVIWDDDQLITDNPIVAELTPATLARAFSSYDPELYIPLTLLTFQIERAIFGYSPFVYHFDNVVLHTLNATLLAFLFRRLGLRFSISLFLAAVLLVHPLNTEAVAWASARKDLLCTALLFGSLLAFLRWRERGRTPDYAVAVAFALLAMLSKALAIMIPVALLLLDLLRGHRWRRADIGRYAPFLALSLLFFVIGLFGKTENIGSLTAMQTLLLAAKATVGYLPLLLWPSDLSIIYLQTTPITALSREFVVPLVLCALVASLLIAVRGTPRWVVAGIAWYVIFLLPSFSNFVKAGDVYVMSDRYPYVAQAGLLLILGHAIAWCWRRHPLPRTATISVAAIVLLAFGVAARERSKVWASSETLFRDALSKNDGSVVLHYNLGVFSFFRGDLEEAEREYRRAIELDPSYVDAHRGLARLAKDRGDRAEAIRILRDAVAAKADDVRILNDLGALLIDDGKSAEAVPLLERAIELLPAYADAHANLGTAYGNLERFEEAVRELKEAQRLRGQ